MSSMFLTVASIFDLTTAKVNSLSKEVEEEQWPTNLLINIQSRLNVVISWIQGDVPSISTGGLDLSSGCRTLLDVLETKGMLISATEVLLNLVNQQLKVPVIANWTEAFGIESPDIFTNPL
ncbi:hypothetical protein DFH05DRAFT_1464482 [Lentinula detonsa]|uniref:Uncharacterized protein n=1 Tax=Lentinula detonsa TaxID=2804962 RepID=A0A9W8NQ20_9AGAR|nr:hypothetical protein DFH05DRAFT_1464482 [Lentinula detonsa]